MQPFQTQDRQPDPELKGKTIAMNETRQQNSILIVLVVLLTLQVLLSGYQIIHDISLEQQKEESRVQLAAEVAQYNDTLDELTIQMLADYKAEVYNNPNVDSAAKQEVMGTEYNFMALMLLIKQNTRLMEIAAELR